MALRAALFLLSLVFSAALAVSAADAPNLPFVNVTFTAEGRTGTYCKQPPNAVPAWRLERGSKAKTYSCLKHPKMDGHWTMLNAYLSGGSRSTGHWKVKATGFRDEKCLKDWTYYGKDGVWIVEKVKEYTTTGDSMKRPWCALPMPQVKKNTKAEPKGVEGSQWAFCTCTDKPPSETHGADTGDGGAYVPGQVYAEPEDE